jgi:hypothetical protein
MKRISLFLDERIFRFLSRTAAERLTARFLASRWKELPRLTPDEVYEFGKDVETARSELPALAAAYFELGAKSRPSNNATTP